MLQKNNLIDKCLIILELVRDTKYIFLILHSQSLELHLLKLILYSTVSMNFYFYKSVSILDVH